MSHKNDIWETENMVLNTGCTQPNSYIPSLEVFHSAHKSKKQNTRYTKLATSSRTGS